MTAMKNGGSLLQELDTPRRLRLHERVKRRLTCREPLAQGIWNTLAERLNRLLKNDVS
jgi:hypothetical protein